MGSAGKKEVPTLDTSNLGVKEEMKGAWEKPSKEWPAQRQGQVGLVLGQDD